MPAQAKRAVDKGHHASLDGIADRCFVQRRPGCSHNIDALCRVEQRTQLRLHLGVQRLKLVAAVADHRCGLRCHDLGRYIRRTRNKEALRRLRRHNWRGLETADHRVHPS